MRKILSLYIILYSFSFFAQKDFPVNGVRNENTNFRAFVNATIHVNSTTLIENGTLIEQEGIITYVGGKIKLPENTVVYDLKGKHMYPSFIDLYSSYGLPEIKKKERSFQPQYESSKKGPYSWNEAIRPEVNAMEQFAINEKKAEELTNIGFGVVLSHNMDGIARGTSVLTTLGKNTEHKTVINPNAAAHYSFQKGSSKQQYPSSLMGCIALLRQTYLDASWHKNMANKQRQNLSLDAFNESQALPQIFDVKNKYSIMRADKVGDEFGIQYIVKGNGDEYQQLAEVKSTNAPLIIPINFPSAYNVEDAYDAMYVTLAQLKHWELAPSNPKLLERQSIEFAITLDGTSPKEFLKNLRKAVSFGLSKEQALRSLTETPAKLIKADDKIGSLEVNKWANFIITSGDLFTGEEEIFENWIAGERNVISELNRMDVRGEYNLNVNQDIRTLKIKGAIDKPKAFLHYNIVVDSVSVKGDLVLDSITGKPIKVTQQKKVKTTVEVVDKIISLTYSLKDGVYRLTGNVNFDSGSWDGKAQLPSGEWTEWVAIRKEKVKEEEKEDPKKDSIEIGKFAFPMMAYGWDSLPKLQAILIKNATVWTLEEKGKLEETDVLIQNGKIKYIGKIVDVADPNTIIIDGTGKHLSPGIIDEHSHIAIERGVNEGSHAVTAEVRIGDVLKSNDINIYRQLAGGTTCSQLLHGSANPVGGQSALIKLKWGFAPDSMKVENAPGFIKFALGENVKQSNWGEFNKIRFPQTRMGVEQVYYDIFIRAKEYEQEWKQYDAIPKKKKVEEFPPRRDLQLETILEILNSTRFVTCHSYIQSEINMLMHVADSMGFTLNTFTHILEGYKVADKMKAHGAGGSTFSDWWAYKYEVKDAIPYNASILNQMGIVTAINSDDAEMGRRLNQEAAKGVKYGGMTEEEALKMVTLNPAKLLHVDDRMGSIKVGKDADVVLWSDNPLSIYAKAEKTIVDGLIFYDSERDKRMRKEIQMERARIITKMINEKNGGAPTQEIVKNENKKHVCGTISDDGN